MALSGESDYSIVLPAYNEEALLGATLERVRTAMAAAPLAGEVVVCDNASTDRTPEVARTAGAVLISEPARHISRARNEGARSARGPHGWSALARWPTHPQRGGRNLRVDDDAPDPGQPRPRRQQSLQDSPQSTWRVRGPPTC